MRIYVGNLPYSTDSEGLRALFALFGKVSSSSVAVDRESGRSRGFGFVEMPDATAAWTAISSLDGNEFGGRNIRVREAQRQHWRGEEGK